MPAMTYYGSREGGAHRNAAVLVAAVLSLLISVCAEVLLHLPHCHWVQRPRPQQQSALRPHTSTLSSFQHTASLLLYHHPSEGNITHQYMDPWLVLFSPRQTSKVKSNRGRTISLASLTTRTAAGVSGWSAASICRQLLSSSTYCCRSTHQSASHPCSHPSMYVCHLSNLPHTPSHACVQAIDFTRGTSSVNCGNRGGEVQD